MKWENVRQKTTFTTQNFSKYIRHQVTQVFGSSLVLLLREKVTTESSWRKAPYKFFINICIEIM